MDYLQERKEIVAKLKPIDDAFAEKIFEDVLVCQEVLATILEEPELNIVKVIPQNSIKNLQGRSVRLDVLCRRGDGSLCNIELQKADVDNHIKRTRYNAACITANVTEPGTDFENVPDVYVIYISRFDIFQKGKTIYHLMHVISETGEIINNGQHVIFVNTKINDGNKIAKLMACFEQEYVDNPEFPRFSERVQYFKNDKEENGGMCELIENYAKKVSAEYAKETAKKLFDMKMSLEEIRKVISAELLSDEDLRKIEEESK